MIVDESHCSARSLAVWVFYRSDPRFSTSEVDDEVPELLVLVPAVDLDLYRLYLMVFWCDSEIAAAASQVQSSQRTLHQQFLYLFLRKLKVFLALYQPRDINAFS